MRSELATPLAWGVIFCPMARVIGELASRMAVPAMKRASEMFPPEKVAANIKSGEKKQRHGDDFLGPETVREPASNE